MSAETAISTILFLEYLKSRQYHVIKKQTIRMAGVMIFQPSSSLSALVTLAVYLLGLSLFVQVLQEIYKFLSSSKSRTTKKVLRDFLGPPGARVVDESWLINLEVRGPFELSGDSAGGNLLPVDPQILTTALEETANPWIRDVVAQLRVEASLQEKQHASDDRRLWSPAWGKLLSCVVAASKVPTDGRTTDDTDHRAERPPDELMAFLTTHGLFGSDKEDDQGGAVGSGVVPDLSASQLLGIVREQCLPYVVQVEKRISQLGRNFDFAYRRRNLRQTFIFGFVVAFAFNLPFEELYRAARRSSPIETAEVSAQAVALYENLYQLYGQGSSLPAHHRPVDPIEPTDTPGPVEPETSPSSGDEVSGHLTVLDKDEVGVRLAGAIEDLRAVLAVLPGAEDQSATVDYFIEWKELRTYLESGPRAAARFVFGCLLTATLLSFGAPFWNDFTGLLAQMQKGRQTADSAQSQ